MDDYGARAAVSSREIGQCIPISAYLQADDRRSTQVFAKLDTGSSRCFFGPGLAKDLGLKVAGPGGHRARTATGQFTFWEHEVNLVLPDWRDPETDAPVSVRVDGAFTAWSAAGRRRTAILGIVGFLNQFAIAIDDSRQQLWWRRLDRAS